MGPAAAAAAAVCIINGNKVLRSALSQMLTAPARAIHKSKKLKTTKLAAVNQRKKKMLSGNIFAVYLQAPRHWGVEGVQDQFLTAGADF